MEPRKLFSSVWFALGGVSVLMLTIVQANAPKDLGEISQAIPAPGPAERQKNGSGDNADDKDLELGDEKDSESDDETESKRDNDDESELDGEKKSESDDEMDRKLERGDELELGSDEDLDSDDETESKRDRDKDSDRAIAYRQAIPSSAVFGCDAPSAGLRDGHGGTYNNALIITYSDSDPKSVYGKYQGDLAIFTEAYGYSGMFRCGEVAKRLNRFTQNPEKFQNFVFNIDDSPVR